MNNMKEDTTSGKFVEQFGNNDAVSKNAGKDDDGAVYVTEYKDNDVLLGKGTGPNTHPGNITFRKLVAEKRDEYRCTKKGEKIKVAQAIIDQVRNVIGGRFLKEVKRGVKVWVEADEKACVEKTKQSLRDAQPNHLMCKPQKREQRNINRAEGPLLFISNNNNLVNKNNEPKQSSPEIHKAQEQQKAKLLAVKVNGFGQTATSRPFDIVSSERQSEPPKKRKKRRSSFMLFSPRHEVPVKMPKRETMQTDNNNTAHPEVNTTQVSEARDVETRMEQQVNKVQLQSSTSSEQNGDCNLSAHEKGTKQEQPTIANENATDGKVKDDTTACRSALVREKRKKRPLEEWIGPFVTP